MNSVKNSSFDATSFGYYYCYYYFRKNLLS